MARISKETEKLLAYAEAEGIEKLTDEVVYGLVYPDSEYKIYELANALSRKNYDAFMRISEDLSTKGFNELSLLSSISSHFKTLYEVSLIKGSDSEVAVALGIKEYAVKKSREQIHGVTTNQILGIYNAVYGAIADIKCGKITPQSALKKVIGTLFFVNS
jgi:DNA polymerase III delta subunit